MNTMRMTAFAMLSCLPLLGCGNSQNSSVASAGNPAGQPATLFGKAAKKVTDGARQDLATDNIDLHADGRPKAEITSTGELMIDGRAVKVDAEQRRLLLEYRKHVVTVADSAIGVGLDSADLAGKALGVATQGAFSSDADRIGKKIEVGVKDIEQSAKQICGLLPALKVSQDELAIALPEFKPYATMIQSNIDDCMSDFRAAGVGKSVAAATDNRTAEFAGSFVEGISSGYNKNRAEHKGKNSGKVAQEAEAASEKQ
jgi:Protein of unknown function (DUF2884)